VGMADKVWTAAELAVMSSTDQDEFFNASA
jgi:hypothetical protein